MKTKTRNPASRINFGSSAKVLTALALATLVACSGGGGGSDPVATPTPTPVPGTPSPTPSTPTPTPVPAPTSSRQACEANANSTFDAASGTCTTCPPPSVYNQPGVCLTAAPAPAPTPVPTPTPTPTITVPAPQTGRVYYTQYNTTPTGCYSTRSICWANAVNTGVIKIVGTYGKTFAYFAGVDEGGRYWNVREINSSTGILIGHDDIGAFAVRTEIDYVEGGNILIIHEKSTGSCFNYARDPISCN